MDCSAVCKAKGYTKCWRIDRQMKLDFCLEGNYDSIQRQPRLVTKGNGWDLEAGSVPNISPFYTNQVTSGIKLESSKYHDL